MTRIIVSDTCGNSPKNTFLQQLTIAFATRDTELLLRSVADDMQWYIVGTRSIHGIAAFREALEQIKAEEVAELTVDHVLTHGKAGAVNGTVTLHNGQTRAFCDMYEFTAVKGTMIRALTSYVIDLP